MAAVLDGVRVLDLSWGIAGPMAGMVLADNGAAVTKIEPPGGDPSRSLSGARVWNRGKRSAVLDLTDEADRGRFLTLAASADVVLESFSPGTTARLGIDYDTLAAANPRLIYCSITGYGDAGPEAGRPAYDALVSARTGHQWESRGIVHGTTERLHGLPAMAAGVVVPPEKWDGAPREGPVFAGVPWPSIAAFHLAVLGISAALRVREVTGRGQRVHTSLLQGVLATTTGAWTRVERPEVPGFRTSISDPRAPKGFFRCADGRWVHQWTPNPGFVLGVAAGERLVLPEDGPRGIGSSRIGLGPDALPKLQEAIGHMADAFARFTSEEWMQIAVEGDVSIQRVRSPEEALADPLMLADGCVAEVDDPEFGRVRQVGRAYGLAACPPVIGAGAPAVGEHTADIVTEAEAAVTTPVPPVTTDVSLSSPLDGIVVVDLGLAVAGPFGAQMLGDLGADVIRVSQTAENPLIANQIQLLCNRNKRSIALDLKSPEGLGVLLRLVEKADVVHSNMRYNALERLGLDYESLRKVNPRLIYCHTRGHERGPRQYVVGHDQSASALAGVSWMEGGLDDDGRPIWPMTSVGDIGCGLLSAIAVVQALYHRDRTGEGQFVDTAIVCAHLLNTSSAWITPDGAESGARQRLDAMQMGWNALYRLYRCGDGRWLCVAALTEDHWLRLCAAVGRPGLASDERFVTAAGRAAHDRELIDLLEPVFASRAAEEWFVVLDDSGVPCEVSDENWVLRAFDGGELAAKGWLASYDHPIVGRMEAFGMLVDFSETPGSVRRPPYCPGQHTRQIMHELGYDDDAVDKLVAQGAANETTEVIAAFSG